MPWLISGLPALIFRMLRYLIVRLAYRGGLAVIDRSFWLFAQVSAVIIVVVGGALFYFEGDESSLRDVEDDPQTIESDESGDDSTVRI